MTAPAWRRNDVRLRVRAATSAFVALLTVTLAGRPADPAATLEAPGWTAATECRTPQPAPGAAVPAIAWTQPARDRASLDAWCRATGRPVVLVRASAARADAAAPVPSRAAADDELAVLSWNLHVGSADLPAVVERLRAGDFTGGRPVSRFVLLLQEAYRDDDTVPVDARPGMAYATALGHDAGSGHRRTDVVALARSLGLSLFYVPSMRNGAPGETREDRGNAILSTEPLSRFEAIELPFAKQRRVAIAATVTSRDASGTPFTLRVASVHLESTNTARRLWVLVSGARVRQARELLQALRPHERLVVGGDFNTWFGFSDETYHAMTAVLTDASAGDRRRTFAGLFRLDHLFAKVPSGWSVQARRLDDRWGSDHFPLLARVTTGGASSASNRAMASGSAGFTR